jgi:hypothetical protein
MPKEQATKKEIQARYAEEVRLRTAARIAELNVANTRKDSRPQFTKNHDSKTTNGKLKMDPTPDRGRKILEDTKRKMRLAQEARTRTRLEEIDYAACEALGNELLKQFWELENELVAQAEEPWSDDEDSPPQLNVPHTNVTREEHNHNASFPINAHTRVEHNCESSSVPTNLVIETPD